MVGGLVLGTPGQNSSRQRGGRGGGNWKAGVERRERKGEGPEKPLAGLDLSPPPSLPLPNHRSFHSWNFLPTLLNIS